MNFKENLFKIKNAIILLGHEIPNSNIHGKNYKDGWFECINCNAKIYIDSRSRGKPFCWKDNIFGKEDIDNCTLIEFNLTCNEVIILKIID